MRNMLLFILCEEFTVLLCCHCLSHVSSSTGPCKAWQVMQSIRGSRGRGPWKFALFFCTYCSFSDLSPCSKNKCSLVKVPISRVLVKSRLCHAGEREVEKWIKEGGDRIFQMQKAPTWVYCCPLPFDEVRVPEWLSKSIIISSFPLPTPSPSLISRNEKGIWWGRTPGMKFMSTFLKQSPFF